MPDPFPTMNLPYTWLNIRVHIFLFIQHKKTTQREKGTKKRLTNREMPKSKLKKEKENKNYLPKIQVTSSELNIKRKEKEKEEKQPKRKEMKRKIM